MTNNSYGYDVSKCIVNNIISLNDKYNEIVSKIYNSNNDPAVQEYNRKTADLVMKFADKNENGSIKFDQNKNPIITEQREAFDEELKKLQEENKELIDKVNKAPEENNKWMNEDCEISVWVPDVDFEKNPEYQIPPVLVHYLLR
jgi:hypothetical protein